ncbi:hypothetical protein COLO4_25556 [Corchorus olitorius]|uniref:Uncharacterized protein n=1 Tax=Corchorus olitorius TaxID=93759 RepID=A0A1R3I1Q5_9ROSI|nr:hypothetical protein COLO4_25556 [Corchorus olitorius]
MNTSVLSSPPKSSDGMKLERSQFVPFGDWIVLASLSSAVSILYGLFFCTMRCAMTFDPSPTIVSGMLAVFMIVPHVIYCCWHIYVAALLFMQHLPEVTKKIKSAWDNTKYPSAVCASACCCSLLLSLVLFYMLNEVSKIMVVKYGDHPFYCTVYAAPYSICLTNSLSVAAFCVGRRCLISLIDSFLYGTEDSFLR